MQVSLEVFSVNSSGELWKRLTCTYSMPVAWSSSGDTSTGDSGCLWEKRGCFWGGVAICTLCSLFNLKYNSHTEAYEISTMNNYKVSAHVTTS